MGVSKNCDCYCMCRKYPKVSYCIQFFLFLIGLGSIIQVFFATSAIEKAFKTQIEDRWVMNAKKQRQNKQNYKHWVSNNYSDSPIQYFEYWMYNITNPYAVADDGALPIFQDIGPFIYKRIEMKNEVEFFEDETYFNTSTNTTLDMDDRVTYRVDYTFVFQPDLSSDLDRDELIWTVSGPMMAFRLFIQNNFAGFPLDGFLPCVDDAIKSWKSTALFYHSSINDHLHGQRDPNIEAMCTNDTTYDTQIRTDTYHRMVTAGSMHIAEFTGNNNLKRLRELIEFRNMTYAETGDKSAAVGGKGNLWEPHFEYILGGRETRQWPPHNHVKKNSELVIWSIEKYRKTKYLFQKKIKWKGLELLRFRLDDRELENCTIFEDVNGTYINESHTCKYRQDGPKGVFNLQNFKGAPLVVSKGQFLDSPYYIENTMRRFGLPDPDPEFDDQFFDIDQATGTVFRNWHSYQLNFLFQDMLRPYPTNFTNVTIYGSVMPFGYVRIEAMATNKQVNWYVNVLSVKESLEEFSLYGGPIIGVFIWAIMCFMLCKTRQYSKGVGSSEDGYDQFDNANYGTTVADTNRV